MNPKPSLTIVIEMDTKEITGGNYPYEKSLQEWIQQADALAPHRCEILVCSSTDHGEITKFSTPNTSVRNICSPGKIYYGLKNSGARHAQGDIVVFSDSDCRPGSGFLRGILAAFESPGILCVAGRTFYDSENFFARLNTATSFGYLHHGEPILKEGTILSHNVAIRRSSYEDAPFGFFDGRLGGDAYMTKHYRNIHPIPLIPEMVIYHENPSFDLRALLDRHFRSILFPFIKKKNRRSFKRVYYLIRSTLRYQCRQFRQVRHWGKFLDIKPWHYPLVVLILMTHFLMDVLASLPLVICRKKLQEIVHQQFGAVTPQQWKALYSN